jgi:hypothetical protein
LAGRGADAAARTCPKAGCTTSKTDNGVSPANSAVGTSDAVHAAATVSRSFSVSCFWPAEYGAATYAATYTSATTAATWASEEEKEEEECRYSGADGVYCGVASAAFGTDYAGVHGIAIFGGKISCSFDSCADAFCCPCS